MTFHHGQDCRRHIQIDQVQGDCQHRGKQAQDHHLFFFGSPRKLYHKPRVLPHVISRPGDFFLLFSEHTRSPSFLVIILLKKFAPGSFWGRIVISG